MVSLFAFVLATSGFPQLGIAWGEPNEGLSVGLEVTGFPDGPPLFSLHVRNETTAPVVLCTGNPIDGTAVPEFEFRETFRRHLPPFTFTVAPPRGNDFSRSPVLGVPRYVQIEPRETVVLHKARFWIPGKPGDYAVRATYVQPEHAPWDWHPTFRPGGLTLVTGTRYITVRPSDCIDTQGG